jgi:hypothetical protein
MGVDSTCSGPANRRLRIALSSFVCGSWWCILPLRKFTFHPYGSMARASTRAIAICGHGVQHKTRYEREIDVPRSYLDSLLSKTGQTSSAAC